MIDTLPAGPTLTPLAGVVAIIGMGALATAGLWVQHVRGDDRGVDELLVSAYVAMLGLGVLGLWLLVFG